MRSLRRWSTSFANTLSNGWHLPRSGWKILTAALEGSHHSSGRVDKPAPGALGNIDARRKTNWWNFLPTDAYSSLKNSAAQVLGTAPWEECVGSTNVLPEVCIASTHFGEPPLRISKAY